MEPTATASWPMYRWQKPPILPNAYASAAFSSKRRMSSIWRSIWRCRSVRASCSDWEGAVAVAMGCPLRYLAAAALAACSQA